MNKRNTITGKSWVAALIAALILILYIGPNRIARAGQKAYNRLMLLTMVLDKIERYYVEEKDPNVLMESAIRGMIASLDPHTIYLTPAEYSAFKTRYQGYQGIGLKYSRLQDRLLVISVMPNSPASEKGLRPGDKIVRIASKKVEFLGTDNIASLLQEAIVRLEIEREGFQEPFSIALPKRTIPPVTIPCVCMLNDSTAYIKIDHFSDGTPEELDQAFSRLAIDTPSYLVLDLRDNGGGSFIAGIKVADRFLHAGKMIAYTRGRGPGANMQYFATTGDKIPMWPLVLLVNNGSASDAEIVAGAIQDWDRGLIIGQSTYGKALVQTEYAFQDGSALLLTTARFLTPLGRSLQKNEPSESRNEPARQVNDAGSTYRTPLGRIVHGGGSIVPDIDLPEETAPLSTALQSLITAEQNYFAEFADQYFSSHPELGKNKEFFINRFQVSDDMLRDFLIILRHSGAKFTLQDFGENKMQLQFLIKREIAALFWGEEARYTINILADPEVIECGKYLKQAQNLLAQ